jgi:ankyrin repeat protein
MAASEWDDPAARQAVFDALERRGDVALVQAAVDSGFPPTAVDKLGKTLLLIAVQVGASCLVPHMLAKGWDANAISPGGLYAIHFACMLNQSDVVQELVKAGASLQSEAEGWNALFYAVAAGSPGHELLEWLATRLDVDWLQQDDNGDTALSILQSMSEPTRKRKLRIVEGAVAAQPVREARWSPLRAAFVGAVATAK